MDQSLRPKRHKYIPARFTARDCELYDFHPTSESQDNPSATQSFDASFTPLRRVSVVRGSSQSRPSRLTQRAHVLTLESSVIAEANCDSISDIQSRTLPLTVKQSRHSTSENDSAVCVEETRRTRRKRPKNATETIQAHSQVANDLSYLDRLLLFAIKQEEAQNAKHNQESQWLYGSARTRRSMRDMSGNRRSGEVVGKVRFVVSPPEPMYWERAHYQQRWETTTAARSFKSAYTEADDFSSSEEEGSTFHTPTRSTRSTRGEGTMNPNGTSKADPLRLREGFIDRLELISLTSLYDTLARHVLDTLFRDCIRRYGSPGWFREAHTILRLTPEEEDWMESNRLRCLNRHDLKETAVDEMNTWHYNATKYYREEARIRLDNHPETALLWLQENEKSWFCTKADVKTAVLYLLQRGYSLKMVEGIDLGRFLDVESEDEEDDAENDMTEDHKIKTRERARKAHHVDEEDPRCDHVQARDLDGGTLRRL